MATDRGYRHGITAFFVFLSLLPTAIASPRITRLRTSAVFSAKAPENRWSVPIKSPDGRTAYFLFLEPDFDIGGHVVTLELALRRPDAKPGAENLFDSTGKWHGLQAYDFAAGDLAQGAQKSVFGERRTLSVKSLGLVVRVAVSEARVSSISPGNYQLDALKLEIEADNLNP